MMMIVIAVLLALAAIIIMFSLLNGRNKYPEGNKITYTYRGYTVTTILHPMCKFTGTQQIRFVKCVEKAVAAAGDAWQALSGVPDQVIKEVVVYLVPRDSATSAFVCPVYVGQPHTPLLVIGAEYDYRIMTTGRPVIWEYIQAARNKVVIDAEKILEAAESTFLRYLDEG